MYMCIYPTYVQPIYFLLSVIYIVIIKMVLYIHGVVSPKSYFHTETGAYNNIHIEIHSEIHGLEYDPLRTKICTVFFPVQVDYVVVVDVIDVYIPREASRKIGFCHVA